MKNLKKQLIRLGNTNPELRNHISSVLDKISASSRDIKDLWNQENNQGMGFNPRGGDDINDLRGAGTLISRAKNPDDIAVYDYGDTYLLVGDANGPLAVQVGKDEVDFDVTASDRRNLARYEKGKPADPTENMSEEDAEKWREMNDKYEDKFKKERESSIKDQLIRLGSDNPELRDHLRPVLSYLVSKKKGF